MKKPIKIEFKTELIITLVLSFGIYFYILPDNPTPDEDMSTFIKVEYGMLIVLMGWYFWLKPLLIKDGYVEKNK